MSVFGGLNIAASTLTTFQRAIDVTSHNISNANTEGYSLQTTQVTSASADKMYGMFFGRGVQMGSITRSFDENIFKGLVASDSSVAYFKELQTNLKAIEPSMGTLDSTGLNGAMDDFFAAWQALSHSPSDAVVQSNVVSAAENVQMQVARMNKSIADVQLSTNDRITTMVDDVNLKLEQIATLNQQIVSAVNTQSQQFQANDAMDLRDNLVRQIAQVLPVATRTDADGSVTVTLEPPRTGATGLSSYTLVGGTMPAKVLSWDGTVMGMNIASSATATPQAVTGFDRATAQSVGFNGGGKVGALLDLASKDYLTQLDDMVSNFAFQVNKLHSGGTGLTAISSYTSGKTAGAATASLIGATGVPFSNQITAGEQFEVHVLDAAGTPLTPASKVTVTIGAGETMQTVADQINVAFPGYATVAADGSLTVDGGVNRIVFGNVLDAAGSSVPSNFLAAYEINALFHGDKAVNLTVDQATVNDPGRLAMGRADAATSAIALGNNDIAKDMLTLIETQSAITGGNPLTIQERLTGLVGSFGTHLNNANTRLTFHESEAQVLKTRRDEFSGVNVDDQMIKIMEFQRSYQAAAKLVQTSEKMLDSLMGLVR